MPYYGATGIGQISLSASTLGGEPQIKSMRILSKSASDTKATVTFTLDEGTAAPSSGECAPLPVVVYDEYAVQDRKTETDGDYETGAGGFIGAPGSTGWLGAGSCSYDAATKTYTQNIDIAINTDTENSRTGAVIVFSPSGREVTRFVVEQDKLPQPSNPDKPIINGIEIQKLVPSGANSANCYIITVPGRYELPAYEGAHSNAELAEAHKFTGKPAVVWNDTPANTVELFQGHLADNKIIIDINPIYANGEVSGHGSSIANGNALVAIKDNAGNILWSWHLWFCKDNPCNDNATSNTMMDRNLGAKTSANIDLSLINVSLDFYWKDGLYYQWGRKDPLNINITTGNDRYASEQGGSKDAATLHPNTFYKSWNGTESTWSSGKSTSDPCPPGYKVPQHTVWNKEKSESLTLDWSKISRTNAQNDLFIYSIAPAVTFPYGGFLDASGGHSSGTSGQPSEVQTYTDEIQSYYEYINLLGGETEDVTRRKTPPVKFRNIKWRRRDVAAEGVLWSSGNEVLRYGFNIDDIQIISYEYCTGVWKQKWALFVPYYEAEEFGSWSSAITYNDTKSGIADGKLDADMLKKILQSINGNWWENIDWGDIGSSINKLLGADDLIYEKSTDRSKTNGYQVRCVKE